MCRMKNIVGILLSLFVSTFFSKSMAQDYVVVDGQKLKKDVDLAKVITFQQEEQKALLFNYGYTQY